MKPEHAAWIAAYLDERQGIIRGMCGHATDEMVKSFPELTRTGGFVHHDNGGITEHWWCVTSDGEVVDPTAAQFATGSLRYEEFDPADQEHRENVRVGRCLNCGMDLYGADRKMTDLCDEDCRAEFAASLNAAIRR